MLKAKKSLNLTKKQLMAKIAYLNRLNKEMYDSLQTAQKNIHTLKSILELMPGNIYWKKRDGTYEFCNINAARIVGFSHYSEVREKRARDFIPEKYVDAIEKIDEEIMSSNCGRTMEENAHDEYGNDAIYLTTKIPLRENNEVVGMLGISMNITEQKRILKEMRKAKELAENADKTKSAFLRNMEHDIRTPLAGIIGLVKLLLSQAKGAKNIKYLKQIQNCSNELLKYCEGVLELSQIGFKAPPVLDKRFDLHNLMYELISIEMPAAKHKHLVFKLHVEKNVPQYIIGDHFRISRMLLNLISNAIKFTNTGYVMVHLALIKNTKGIMKTKKNTLLKFIIEDTGKGVPTHIQDFLFKKDDSQNINSIIGIGLIVVKQLAAEMGAKLDVISHIGKGTKFIILVPCKLPLDCEFNS